VRATTFEEFTVNRRVRYFSEHPEFEPVGTIVEVDPISQHVLVEWDDEHPRSDLDALSAMRKLEVL
jgi:hypothetical protein